MSNDAHFIQNQIGDSPIWLNFSLTFGPKGERIVHPSVEFQKVNLGGKNGVIEVDFASIMKNNRDFI